MESTQNSSAEERSPVILALAGKGGVGKTSVSALFVRILKETYPDKRILAIDADPAIGLATALNVDVTSTVDDIRKLFVESVEEGRKAAAIELLGEAKYRIADSLVTLDNVCFLAIGRPESAGCYCKVNAYLKEVISLLSKNFDYIVIDGEAGIEQVNRRVMEKVTHLILVSDASKKGLMVSKTIYNVAKDLVMFRESGLILNRVPNLSLVEEVDTLGLPLLAAIEDDKEMTLSDIHGDSVLALPKESEIYQKAKQALKKLKLI